MSKSNEKKFKKIFVKNFLFLKKYVIIKKAR